MGIEEQEEVEFIVNAQTTAEFFFEAVDLAGSTTSLAQLKMFVNNAPETVKNDNEYIYLKGLLTGRKFYEEPCDKIIEPLKELEKYVYDAPQSIRETKAYYFKLGVYDGRMIHEMNPFETVSVSMQTKKAF